MTNQLSSLDVVAEDHGEVVRVSVKLGNKTVVSYETQNIRDEARFYSAAGPYIANKIRNHTVETRVMGERVQMVADPITGYVSASGRSIPSLLAEHVTKIGDAPITPPSPGDLLRMKEEAGRRAAVLDEEHEALVRDEELIAEERAEMDRENDRLPKERKASLIDEAKRKAKKVRERSRGLRGV